MNPKCCFIVTLVVLFVGLMYRNSTYLVHTESGTDNFAYDNKFQY